MKTPEIDFSLCSNEDVAELLFATFEGCGYLCDIYDFYYKGTCGKCPANKSRSTYVGYSVFRNNNSVCVAHDDVEISKPEIAIQCWVEIDRRIQKEEAMP